MQETNNRRRILIWAYLVELLASVGICIFVFSVASPKLVAEFFVKSNAGWLGLEGVLLAGAIAVWVTHFQIVGTDFGKYLRFVNSEKVFMDAFNVGVGSHFLAFILLIFSGSNSGTILTICTMMALVYALINTITIFVNAMAILKLKSIFDFEYGKIKASERDHPRFSPLGQRPPVTLDGSSPMAQVGMREVEREKAKQKIKKGGKRK